MLHGNVYRSDSMPPTSKFYDQGKFGRMFPTLPPFSLDSPSLRTALMKIGERRGIMDAQDDVDKDPLELILNPVPCIFSIPRLHRSRSPARHHRR